MTCPEESDYCKESRKGADCDQVAAELLPMPEAFHEGLGWAAIHLGSPRFVLNFDPHI